MILISRRKRNKIVITLTYMCVCITILLSGCALKKVDNSAVEITSTPTIIVDEPMKKTTPSAINESPSNLSDKVPTAIPTQSLQDIDELRGVSNGNSVSGTDTIYKNMVYTVMRDYDTGGYAVYGTNMDGEIIHTLYQGYAHDLNVYKDKVYFVADEDTTDTFRCDLDGSNLTVINSVNFNHMILFKDMIYGITADEKKIVRCELDGSGFEELLADECQELIIDESVIYYSNYCGIYKMNLDGSENQLLYDEGSCYYLNSDEDWLYFLTNDTVCKIKKDGTEFTVVREGTAFNLHVHDDYIYFIDIKKDRELCRMKKDGSDEICLEGPRTYSISILGDYIRYQYGLDEDLAIYQMKLDGTDKKLIRNDISQRYD